MTNNSGVAFSLLFSIYYFIRFGLETIRGLIQVVVSLELNFLGQRNLFLLPWIYSL